MLGQFCPCFLAAPQKTCTADMTSSGASLHIGPSCTNHRIFGTSGTCRVQWDSSKELYDVHNDITALAHLLCVGLRTYQSALVFIYLIWQCCYGTVGVTISPADHSEASESTDGAHFCVHVFNVDRRNMWQVLHEWIDVVWSQLLHTQSSVRIYAHRVCAAKWGF